MVVEYKIFINIGHNTQGSKDSYNFKILQGS